MAQVTPPLPRISDWRWRTPMKARDIHQKDRASTPLELLFDLVFVVAVSRGVNGLAHDAEAGRLGAGLVVFAMVFFSIWWAWMNFTWFASAYDTDDGPFRILVMIQMAGVLILAAGVDRGALGLDLKTITLGYVVMRLALVTQWLRAGHGDPLGRVTAHRYAYGILTVQVGWLARMALPNTPAWTVSSFAALAVAEMLVPVFAERSRRTNWHPHHIAERYGLFVLILLGESVLASVTGVRDELTTANLQVRPLVVAMAGLVILFALWWIYFLAPMAKGLAHRRDLAFRWGYSHVVVFFALGSLGAGLDLAVMVNQGSEHQVDHLGLLGTGYFLAGAVGLFLAGWWVVSGMARGQWRGKAWLSVNLGALAVAPLAALTPVAESGAALAVAAVTVMAAGWLIIDHHRALKQYRARADQVFPEAHPGR